MPRPPREVFVALRVRPPVGGQAMMGDPFLGGFLRAIGGGLRRIAPIAGRVIGGLTGVSIPRAPMGHGSSGIPAVPRIGTGGGIVLSPGTPRPPALVLPRPGFGTGGGVTVTGTPRRRRRINPLNPRALRRSLRRIEGFRKFALRAGFVPRGTRVRKVFPFRRARKRRAA